MGDEGEFVVSASLRDRNKFGEIASFVGVLWMNLVGFCGEGVIQLDILRFASSFVTSEQSFWSFPQVLSVLTKAFGVFRKFCHF
jgi:hypothetical protein